MDAPCSPHHVPTSASPEGEISQPASIIESTHGKFIVLFCEFPVVQVPLNEATDDDETKNQKVHHCEHFGNEGRLTSPQGQQSYGKAFGIL